MLIFLRILISVEDTFEGFSAFVLCTLKHRSLTKLSNQNINVDDIYIFEKVDDILFCGIMFYYFV